MVAATARPRVAGLHFCLPPHCDFVTKRRRSIIRRHKELIMTKIRIVLLAFCLAATQLHADSGYKVTTKYPVPGEGGFDYVTVDSDARRVYLSHATQVNVIDAD